MTACCLTKQHCLTKSMLYVHIHCVFDRLYQYGSGRVEAAQCYVIVLKRSIENHVHGANPLICSCII